MWSSHHVCVSSSFIFVLVLCLSSLTTTTTATEQCPQPVVDQIGVTYKTVQRFNKIRGDKSSLETSKGSKKYTLHFCNDAGDGAVIEHDGDKNTMLARVDSKSILVGAENWMLIQYRSGDPYPSTHCNGKPREAWISIRCEEHGATPTLKLIEKPRFKSGSKHVDMLCYHLFEYNHPDACSPRGLSGGSIFLIVVIVIILTYLCGGVLYKRFVKGAKGRQQLPNNETWERVGNYLADGCSLVCRNEESSNTYHGMAQELNIDNTDDDDEENLLTVS